MAHPNVETINALTCAAVAGDRDALNKLFTPDAQIHARGPLPNTGDYVGGDGLMQFVGGIMEATKGDTKLEQLFCVGEGEWAAEWERALFTRDGRTMDVHNSFVYRFENGRIAEMWFTCTGAPEQAAFWA
jgi:ketosteroid isomerase-like protein